MNISRLFALIGIGIFSYGAYTPVKAQLAQYLIQNAWEVSTNTGNEVQPWSWMDSHPVMRLNSSKHNQSLVVLEGDTGNVLAFAPGHNSQSANPHQKGTVVISAHRDTHFNFLKKVALGDVFEVDSLTDKQSYQYQVDDIKVIDSNKQEITLNENQSELKLVTCYPFNAITTGGPLRYVVSAKLVEN
ncbi:class GN sortase [Candidatus Thioglobus sp.]|nr:class GN sortase [Candidatus Thioglobus sp.]